MAKILWGPETPANLLATDLNLLANDAGFLSTAISTGENQFLKLSLSIGITAARDAAAYVKTFILPSMGGLYPDTALTEPLQAYAIQHFYFKPITTAETAITTNIFLPFGDIKVYIVNKTGVAFTATGNVLTYQLGSPESV